MAKIDDFIKALKPQAEAVAKVTGIPAESILAQAGLESGWNLNPAGMNFFGIKPGSSWKGSTVLIRTKEYLKADNQGSKFSQVYSIKRQPSGLFLYDVLDTFRAYPSAADSFADWAALIRTRFPAAYAVRNDKAAFAKALQAGKYATDPSYADKLVSVLNSVERRLGVPLTKLAAGAVGLGLAALVGFAALFLRR